MLGDSSAMHDLVTKEGSSSRSRHFERATVLIKYAVLKLMVVCYLIGTKFMSADVFTKATDEWTFKTMRAVLRNEPRGDAFGLKALGLDGHGRACSGGAADGRGQPRDSRLRRGRGQGLSALPDPVRVWNSKL